MPIKTPYKGKSGPPTNSRGRSTNMDYTVKSPSDYISQDALYAYLGHFAQEQYLTQGHNTDFVTPGSNTNPGFQPSTGYIQGEAPPSYGVTAMNNPLARSIAFPVIGETLAPQYQVQYPSRNTSPGTSGTGTGGTTSTEGTGTGAPGETSDGGSSTGSPGDNATGSPTDTSADTSGTGTGAPSSSSGNSGHAAGTVGSNAISAAANIGVGALGPVGAAISLGSAISGMFGGPTLGSLANDAFDSMFGDSPPSADQVAASQADALAAAEAADNANAAAQEAAGNPGASSTTGAGSMDAPGGSNESDMSGDTGGDSGDGGSSDGGSDD